MYSTLLLRRRCWSTKSTDVDHLSLHVMVRELDTPDKQDLRKLQLLKDELVSRCGFLPHGSGFENSFMMALCSPSMGGVESSISRASRNTVKLHEPRHGRGWRGN